MTKRRGQWFGDRRAITVPDIPGEGDPIMLLEPAQSLESIRDIVFERCILCLSIHRLGIATITDFEYMVYLGRVADGSTIPLEALNPRSALQTTMAHASIMHVGALPVPPVTHTFDSAGAYVSTITNREVQVVNLDFSVKRSVNRNSEVILLTMATDVDSIVQVNVLWRTYYTYA